ncbi:YncE family protein [Variovorax sp. VaC1]|uniref:YncE family protein n=1 Tax=Variovorax sp. VaC1 TaxID=3373132 RepID=UPI003749A0A5
MTLKFTAIVGFCLALVACGGSGDSGGAGGFSGLAGAGAAGTNGQQAKVGLTPEVLPEQSLDGTKAFSFKEANSAGATASPQASDSEMIGGLVASTASSGPPFDPASLTARAALKLKRQLLPSEWGIGFASTPGGSVLTRTLRVTDNRGGALPWTATSSAPWLSVTGSGTTDIGPGLAITANPQLATMDTISYATVTLKTSNPDIEAAVIRVGLWRSSQGLTATTTLPTDYTSVVADKIRPYVYAHNGGTSIDIYNAHLGTKVGTIANVGAALSEMTVAPDGSLLYALDRDTESEYLPSKTIVVVDLANLTKTETWPLKAQIGGVSVGAPRSLLAIRTNGKNIVLASDGDAYVDGKHIATLSSYAHWDFTASSDGRKVFAQNNGLSPASGRAYSLDYGSMPDQTLTATLTAEMWGVSRTSGRDIAANADGTALYITGGWSCDSLNPGTLAFIAELPAPDIHFGTNNVEVTKDGRVLCGSGGMYSIADISIYAPDGTTLKTFRFAGYAKGLLERQLVVTPDGTMAVGLTNDPKMAFVPIGSP